MIFTLKDRRKSRDDQKRDLVQLENREDIWRSEVEDKNTEIIELNKRVAVCLFHTYGYIFEKYT